MSLQDLPAFTLMARFRERMRTSVQLYAGTNFCSPGVEIALSSDMGLMPAIGSPFQKVQPGVDEISKMEELVEAQLCSLFHANWAEARLPTCTIANAAVYAAFSNPGDLVVSISLADGGHASHQAVGTVGLIGRTSLSLPLQEGHYEDRAAAAFILQHRPAIVVVGASVILEPYELKATRAACSEVKAILVYDASHVLGLISGGAFQDPFEAGADLITASTYKSFGGPPGGIVLGRASDTKARMRGSVPGPWGSNYDATRLAALSVAADEASTYGQAYAQAMLNNAALLEADLRERGLPVYGPIRSEHTPGTHQIVLRAGDAAMASMLSRFAEAQGLLVGTCTIPGSPRHSGLRIGTQAVTRKGAGREQMKAIAECFSALLSAPEPMPFGSIAAAICTELSEVAYCHPI
jgi:glycine hydroxymethyltransferase